MVVQEDLAAPPNQNPWKEKFEAMRLSEVADRLIHS